MGRQAAFIDWSRLRNPVLAYGDWSVKDVCAYYCEADRMFYLFFSAFTLAPFRTHLVGVTTRDFLTFSKPFIDWDGVEEGVGGFCAPSILRADNRYVLTFNAWGDVPGQPNRLYYSESEDLLNWNGKHRLAANVTEGIRSIDAALAYDNGMYYLIWKDRQKCNPIAASRDVGADGWTVIGAPALDRVYENGQFLRIDGTWRMVLTNCGDPHETHLFAMKGSGASSEDWLEWGDKQVCRVPIESFNTQDYSNAGFLADWRAYDGYFYLFYAGNTELAQYRGRGHCRIGLARSRDLAVWEAPGPEEAAPADRR